MVVPGMDAPSSRRLQRRLRAKGIVYGLRRSYRLGGAYGLWLACLSQTRTAAEAASLFRRLYN